MSTIDIDSFAKWMSDLRGPLVLFARQWNDSGAEDVVQDAFFALVRQIQSRKTPENVSAWLFKAVRTRILENHRSENRRKKREELTVETQNHWFEPNVETELDSQRAVQLLNELPITEREIVVARIWGNLAFDEIAELVGVSKTTAFRKYTKALEILKEKMQ